MSKILLVVSNVSHFYISLPIADGMRRRSYDVVYYIGDEFDESLAGHGYPLKKINIEDKNSVTDDAGKLLEELRNIKPALMVLDMDFSAYLIFSSSLHIPTVLLNIFVPFYKQQNIPPFCSAYIPRNNAWSGVRTEFLWIKYFCSITYLRRFLIFRAKRRRVALLLNAPDLPEADYKRIFPAAKGLAEIHTCSAEFNFRSKAEAGNFYLGHAVAFNRIQPGIDPSFYTALSAIQAQRNHGTQKIVLCAFGGYSRYHEKECVRFYRLLIALFEQTPAWSLVLAVGGHLDPGQFKHPENVVIAQVVPQLKVLEQCDVMITHGGMNSINEGIATATPMLVYPLNKKGDQPGNAARVVFNEIGLRGDIRRERVLSLSEKLTTLLTDCRYKTRISTFRQAVSAQMPLEHTLDYLQQVAGVNRQYNG